MILLIFFQLQKSKREVTPSSTPKSETKSTNPVPTTKSTTAKSTTIQSTTTTPPTTPPTTPTAKKTDKPEGKTVPVRRFKHLLFMYHKLYLSFLFAQENYFKKMILKIL